jgi:hypothetical protein
MRHLIKFLETVEIKGLKEDDIQAKMATLKRAWFDTDDEAGRKHLDEMYNELNEQWLFLRQNKEWMFNFTSGGWNTMMAGDMETAIDRAKAEYAGTSSVTVDEKTFKVVEFNQESYKAAMRNFD